MKTTKCYAQELDDLLDSIAAEQEAAWQENERYFAARAERRAERANAPARTSHDRPAAPIPPRAPASGELKFAYRELAAGRSNAGGGHYAARSR